MSQEDYFRVRLALNRKEKAELECIEYINGFGEQKTSVIKDLLLLGIEVKKGTLGYSDKEKTQLASLQNKVKNLQAQLDTALKKGTTAEAALVDKEKKILELKQIIKELNAGRNEIPTYEQISAVHVVQQETEPGKRKLFSKKTERKAAPEIVKYEAQERIVEDYTSLEDYMIRNKLDQGVMNMVAFAIKNNIDYSKILTMIENGLAPQQMRAYIEYLLAERERDISDSN